MGKTAIRWGTLILVGLMMLSCSKVPITGRRQVNFIPATTINAMSAEQYSEFLNSNSVVKGTPEAQMVARVGQRIRHAVETYFAERGMSEELRGYSWEINLVDSDQVNAWAMPGGKIVVYTGILPIAQTDAGLAAVMGHELSHVIAHHGNERMSQQLVLQMGGMALSKALEKEPQKTQALALAAFGVGSTVFGILPFSRLHESEADRMGLIFMAMAGYDPSEAVNFWTRMSQAHGGQAPPEFLSTHPSNETRIQNLRELQVEANRYYRPQGK